MPLRRLPSALRATGLLATALRATGLLATAAALALMSAVPAGAEEKTAARLYVADRETQWLTTVDLEAGRVLTAIEMPAPANYLLPGNRTSDIFAVHGKAGSVSLVDTGISLEEHGDHADLSLRMPSVWPAVAKGDRPAHVIARGDTLAVFLDGTGEALLLPLDKLPAAKPPRAVRVASGLPHHGVAVPAGGDVLISVAEARGDRNVPVGLALMGRNGTRKAEWRDCPGLHGEAVVGPDVLVGCQDGVLAVTVAADGAKARKLAYPAGSGDARVWTLDPVPGMTAAMGEAGRDGLFLVDVAGGEVVRIALPGDRVHAIPDPEVFAHALMLTADGTLHRVSLLDGRTVAGAKVTGPVDLANRSGPPRPSLAAVAGHVAVLDPAKGEVVRLDSATLKETARIRIEGKPHRMAAAGGRGHVH